MKLYTRDGLIDKFKKLSKMNGYSPSDIDGVSVYSHKCFPYLSWDGEVVLGCIIKDDDSLVLIVENNLPFTTA